MSDELLALFLAASRQVGAEPVVCRGLAQAAAYIKEKAGGTLVVPSFPSGERLNLISCLREAGCSPGAGDLRQIAAQAAAGLTGANFALADTGTIVLESTDEAVRLASTLPERHFVLLDPRKILADGRAAIPLVREMHRRQPRNYLAYITGPSRTADIERVLTIGVHGPRELHILLVAGISDDPLEM